MKGSRNFYPMIAGVVLLLVSLTSAAVDSTVRKLDEIPIDSFNETRNDEQVVEEHHEEGDEIKPEYAVLLPWFVQAVGVVTYFILTRYLHGIPYTCALFLLGVFMGAGAVRTGFDDQLTESIAIWRSIPEKVLFTVFLPGLLFKDAIEINFHLFQASLTQLLLLAFPMVLAGTCLTACVAHFIFPYGWSFQLAMTFGSILSATDPVAVAALLNEVGAPPRLKMHIAGESLLNDGSAVVFYTVFSGIFLAEFDIGLGDDYSAAEAFVEFLRMSLGGTSVGIAYALALIVMLRYLHRRYDHEEIVLQVAASVTVAYLSFYTSEVVCGMSGVIAVVVTGIVTKAFGGGLISDWNVMNSFWSLLEHLLNTLLFALGGIVFGTIISADEHGWTGRDWGYLILLYVLLNVIRLFLMFAFFPVISKIGIGSNWKEALFSSFGGLRGAVGIALAIGLDAEIREATTENEVEIRLLSSHVFGMVAGVAFLTLVINGSLSGPLLEYLALGKSSESRERILESVEESIKRRLLDDFIFCMTDPRFFFVDFKVVRDHISRLGNLSAAELGQAVEQNRESVHPSQYKAPSLDHVLPYIPNSEILKQETERIKRQVFMTSKISHVDLQILDEEDELGEVPEELLTDMRLLFIELLRAAYNAQISYGELDPREYDGFLAYSLLQSIEFAHDQAMQGNPLNDWDLSRIVSTEYIDKTRDIFVSLYGTFFIGQRGDESHPHVPGELKHLETQQLRLTVLRAFSFVDAHKEAEGRFRDKFEGSEGDLRSAFLQVMRESHKQVKRAENVIRSKTKKQLKQVISHYLCIILQNKSARYIDVLVGSGVLLPRESRALLEEIEESIQEIRSCQYAEHPGTVLNDEDDENLSVEETKTLRRRKRVKQKSLL